MPAATLHPTNKLCRYRPLPFALHVLQGDHTDYLTMFDAGFALSAISAMEPVRALPHRTLLPLPHRTLLPLPHRTLPPSP